MDVYDGTLIAGLQHIARVSINQKGCFWCYWF